MMLTPEECEELAESWDTIVEETSVDEVINMQNEIILILFVEKGDDPSGLSFQTFLDDLNAGYDPTDPSIPNDPGIMDPVVPITCQVIDEVN